MSRTRAHAQLEKRKKEKISTEKKGTAQMQARPPWSMARTQVSAICFVLLHEGEGRGRALCVLDELNEHKRVSATLGLSAVLERDMPLPTSSDSDTDAFQPLESG